VSHKKKLPIKKPDSFFRKIWNNVFNVMKNNGWKTTIESIIYFFATAKEFKKNPTILNASTLALSIAKIGVQDYTPYFDEIISNFGYIEIFDSRISNIIVECLGEEEREKISLNSGHNNEVVIKLKNYPVCWLMTGKDKKNLSTSIYVHPDHVDEFLSYVREIIWERYHRSNLVIYSKRKEDFWNIEEDKYAGAQPSMLSANLAEDIKKFVAAGVPRSLLLWGKPGTGKSTAVREICQILGFRYLRFRVEQMSEFKTDSMEQLIKLFSPEAIIVDDFDRTYEQSELLEMLELFHSMGVKCFMATVNDLGKLEDAIVRPGRIDEIVEFNKLDDVAVHTILQASGFDDVFEEVQNWPVAYIQEYCLRRKILGKDRATESITQLSERINKVSRGTSELLRPDPSRSDDDVDPILHKGFGLLRD